MGCVFRYGACRVMVYSNDHSPAHVHVEIKGGGVDRLKIGLGGNPDEVSLISAAGIFRRRKQMVAEAIGQVRQNHAACIAEWIKFHAPH